MSEAAEIAQLRQGLYRFFAGALAPPDPERLATLRSAAVILESYPIADFAYYGAWTHLARLVGSGIDPVPLGPEFVRLFASGTDGALCPPTESFYVARAEGGGIAASVSAVQRTYAALGFGLGGSDEAPDHIVSELNALSWLCGRECEAWAAEDMDEAVRLLADQHRFLRAHLMTWLPRFRLRVDDAGPDAFYAAAVNAVHAFVVHDADWTGALTRRLEGGT